MPRLGHAVGEHFRADLVAALGEGVGHVLEEDQAEDEVLVLRGVHRAAQLVGGLPQCVAQVRHSRHPRQGCLIGFLSSRHPVAFLIVSDHVMSLVSASVPSLSPTVTSLPSSSSMSISAWAWLRRAARPASSASSRPTVSGASTITW